MNTYWRLKKGTNAIWQVTTYCISRHGSYGTSDLSAKILLSDGQTDFADWFCSFGSAIVRKRKGILNLKAVTAEELVCLRIFLYKKDDSYD